MGERRFTEAGGFAVPTRPPELLYALDERPPWGRLAALGLQHAALVAIYLVFVVIVTRAAGVGTQMTITVLSLGMLSLAVAAALQASPIGSGYLAVPVFSAIYLGPSIIAAGQGGLALVFGMTIFAGAVEIALSRALPWLRQLFPPAVSGFIVLIVGISIGLVGIRHTLDVGATENGGADFVEHLFAAMLTAGVSIALAVWGRGPLRLVGPLIGLVAGFVAALALGLVPSNALSTIGSTPFLWVPLPWQAGFDFSSALVPAFAAAALAATLRTVGVITIAQKLNDADWKRPDIGNIGRGVFADGLGCSFAGLVGGIGLATASSLVGVSRAARATSRWIAYACAVFLAAAAFVPKSAAVFLALPLSVAGGMLIFAASLIIASGVAIMVSRGLDSRSTFVVGVSLLLAIGREVFPSYYDAVPPMLRIFTGDAVAVGVLSSVLLTLLFRIGARHRDDLRLEGGTGTGDDFLKLIETRGKAWGAPAEVIERCRAGVAEFLQRLEGSATRVVEAKISYDDLDLAAELDCEGPHPTLPPTAVGKPHAGAHEEDHVTLGVASWHTGVLPDRVETRSDGALTRVRLVFNA